MLRARRRRLSSLATVLLVSAAAVAIVATAARGQGAERAALPPVLQSWKCTGAQFALFNSWNKVAVSNGGTAPTFSTGGRNYCVDSVTAYHWNNGQGATPGTLGLRVVAGLGGAGHLFGPWLSAGSAGQGGAPNVNWTATVPGGQTTVINGTYACQDSAPATWSRNQASKGHGFCAVYVKKAVKATPPPPPPPTFTCTGPQILVFEGFNGFAVAGGGGKPPTFSTKGLSYCAEVVTSYHWNNGLGKAPGTLALVVVKGLGGAPGTTLGPWKANGQAGQGGVPNAGWGAAPTKLPLIINGSYTCKDSDPATWSQNQASHGLGFCRLYGQTAVLSVGGVPVPAPAPPPPAAGGHPTCSPTAPSSYLISPGHAAPGGTVSFLLACQAPVANGFTGAFAPLSVLIYDAASFANLRFVNGYLQPISPSFPVRPPLVPSYRVVGPHDIDVTLPASILHGSYIPVVVYAHGEVPSMNGLSVP